MISRKDRNLVRRLTNYLLNNVDLNQQYNIGALLTSGNKSVIGVNSYIKSHPLTIQSNNYIKPKHAEIDAIARYSSKYDDISSTTMYIVGMSSCTTNLLSNSKPCESCLARISVTKISRIVFYQDSELVSLNFDEFKFMPLINNQYLSRGC